MDVQSVLKEKRESIVLALSSFIAEKKKSWSTVNPWGLDVLERLEVFMSSGKMVRGAFVLWTAKMFGAKEEDAMPAALAMEFLQAALLAHDDIMDGDAMRRGLPSLHKQYESLDSASLADKEHYGWSMAICVGDIALFLAYEVLTKTGDAQLIRVFSEESIVVGLGQMQDVHWGESSSLPSFEEVLSMYEHKTAKYTFCLPFMLGAMIAHQDQSMLDDLHDLGVLLGKLFQLRDDQLGLYGSHAHLGKTIGVDIISAKKTVYYTMLLPLLSSDEKDKILSFKAKDSLSEDELSFVLGLLEKYKVKDCVSTMMLSSRQEAKKKIEQLAINVEAKAVLNDLLVYVVEREK